MNTISTPTKEQFDTFLVYPDFQYCCSSQSSLYGAILAYTNDFIRLYEKMECLRDWKSEEMVNFSKKRFGELAKLAKDAESKEKYTILSNQWDGENNYVLAKCLYEADIEILRKYLFAYDDMISRECDKKERSSVVTPIFSKLHNPIGNEMNLDVVFSSRLKSFYHTVQKLITKTELLDLNELLYYNDIYACRVVISNGMPINMITDYNGAEKDCYYMLNHLTWYILNELHGELLPCKKIGETSSLVYEEYREYVKDYINCPKPNGYRALHVSFRVPVSKTKKIKFEIQIESSLMKHMNELSAPHDIHKKKSKLDLEVDPTSIMYANFLASKRTDGTVLITDDAGLFEPKQITSIKRFHKK